MNVVLYSTNCPRCVVLEKKLQQKEIKFETIKDENLMLERGFVSAPMLEVDGEIMDFKKANEWVGRQ